ncbi:MAG: tripartite tricarboxylate transporter TctB family protein [Deltaproteobacteria bacterium]|nr:tripartite tricarboxylate transporter TctB family protein [Deltaproteobacteria bacterium]
MKKGELIVAAGFLILAGIVIGDMYRTGSGWTEYGPDAGFVPLWEGVLLLISAIVILIGGLRQKDDKNFFVSKEGFWEAVRITFTSVLFTIGIVFLGVYFSTLLFSILFARWLGKHRWISCIVFAVIITAFIYFGMEKGLKITLPKSPLYEKDLFIF